MNRLHTTCAVIALAICQHAYATRAAIPDGNAASDEAVKLTRQYELTSNKIECLFFDTFNDGNDFLVRVREHHTPECGGDPDTSPTLFFLQIRKTDGHALMLDYLTGNFVPLRKPKH